ncbi:DUF2570 domain-containing protein [Salmonella enterica]|uniref:DUF2570 domain-containing protein n=1 Tax=Salmonella montevideo TaxID=115981 RepID=A0A624B7Y7_SALMO|nr:DUF2570 domain-containing protein [Salmonella enterica]EBP9562475.1 DUF2570 domain-containing protein [Salmonella enterica subsp. enterica]ECZ5262979.1 DUF2570 domain-containing protein [Salmonella enterica subsp. enterica serovar Montevideo]EDP9256968.1 DUF2570 domain-containing protein [Salmonella enterica subsp. enterica serovar Newmexico]EDU6325048.1 DUF2570 domain-containing protein [Salmonella enterica subsp. enterica serovar Edinburgh]EDX2437806.1 DUF2570 domain-containing protein [S
MNVLSFSFWLRVILYAGGIFISSWLVKLSSAVKTLTQENQQLSREVSVYKNSLNELQHQWQKMDTALTENVQLKRGIKEKTDEKRKNIRQSLLSDNCAGTPVPDDVIRLQQRSVNARQ